MKKSYSFPALFFITTFVLAFAHITFEYFTGGVKSHHLMNNPDLPAISNWFELLTLPLIGFIVGLRVRAFQSKKSWAGIPFFIFVPILGSLIFGASLAASFILGATDIQTALFIGLLVIGILLPVFRIEYIFGFVLGMTFAIGGVLPLLFALVIASLSFIVHYIAAKVKKIYSNKQILTDDHKK